MKSCNRWFAIDIFLVFQGSIAYPNYTFSLLSHAITDGGDASIRRISHDGFIK